MPETILVEKEGRVAILTINRPDKLNALNEQVRDEMLQILAEIEKDDSVGAVVITDSWGRPWRHESVITTAPTHH